MRAFLLVVTALVGVACATAENGPAPQHASLYPQRPANVPGPPLADPPLQRPTLHLSITGAGLAQLLHALVPKSDSGSYALLGARAYGWQRGPFTLAFDDARRAVVATTDVTGTVEVPGTSLELLLKVTADVQPVITSTHRLVLQAVKVKVESDDRRVRLAEWGAGLTASIEKTLSEKLKGLSVDLSPMFRSLHDKLQAPLFLPLGEANACFSLDVRGLEAGPTVLADGLEKQLALVVAPSITMPCTLQGENGAVTVDTATPAPQATPLPPLHNAGAVEGGPFQLMVPVAAGYGELQKAMRLAFTDGVLFFSEEHKDLFIKDPEIYASDGEVVVKVKLGGFVQKGVRVDVDGDLYLVGRPRVRDNFLEFPDLKPSVETEHALLSLAVALKEEEITQAVRRALRLDLSERLASLKKKLVEALSMESVLVDEVPPLCVRADVGRLELSDVEAHDAYLRVYVKTSALAAAYLPCPARP